MTIEHVAAAWDAAVKPKVKLVLLALANSGGGDEDISMPSIRDIALRVGISERRVSEILHQLCNDGWISVRDDKARLHTKFWRR